ncbi:ATP-dependent helicase brm-like [Sitophilus oryzae]|uniref:ATP-dependent helicase brm-like n=1 Tax=Sitophilus oryzae TaxID=7048 RepID=A0A6J2X2V3_SITOR|nr:ATP-dependent helicase brm-like [Sitophilus oryzae]
MALLNYTSPFLATPNPLSNFYRPPQPPTHQLPPYQTPYSYPPPQKPFLNEDYARAGSQNGPAPAQSHQSQKGPYQLPQGAQTNQQPQGPVFTRVTEDGAKTKVHAVIDYDYEDEDDPVPPVTPIQGPIYLKNGSVPVVPLYSHPVLNNGSFVQIPADDTVLLAENMQDLQNMLNNVITTSREYGLALSVKKTKYMIVTKTGVPNEHLYAEGEELERVERDVTDYWTKIELSL